MTYILTFQLLGEKYYKWIAMLQEFDLEFTATKSKKSLDFTKLICTLGSINTSTDFSEKIPDETLFLINTLDPWYGYIIFYLQTQSFQSELSRFDRRCIQHQSQPYQIIGDTL